MLLIPITETRFYLTLEQFPEVELDPSDSDHWDLCALTSRMKWVVEADASDFDHWNVSFIVLSHPQSHVEASASDSDHWNITIAPAALISSIVEADDSDSDHWNSINSTMPWLLHLVEAEASDYDHWNSCLKECSISHVMLKRMLLIPITEALSVIKIEAWSSSVGVNAPDFDHWN